ncbi:MAG TPA: lipid-transfer protein [Ramlibacter sp.]|nr:lipid-transfer protein [Ramlibacter sp.]
MSFLSDKAAIVGLGATEFSKDSGRSELQLAVEAVTAALADAGIDPERVDGLCTFTMDNSSECEVFRNIGGRNLKFFSRIHYGGGGAIAPLQQAAMAVACGVADVVVCYRALNERSGDRFGQPRVRPMPETDMVLAGYHAIHGVRTAASRAALGIRRYMHESGATSLDFAQVSIAARRHAATNPKAFFFGRPITLDDYLASRMIADPLRLLDCCQESDGAVAVVVTRVDAAQTLRQPPVLIRAAAQGCARNTMTMTSFYGPDIALRQECHLVADQLYAMARTEPAAIQTAVIYDHFGPAVLPALEGYGFCEWGQAKDFVKGGNIELGGALPINTHGGQLGEAYIHGMNGIAEAVRQLRGTAVNQVAGARQVLVTAGSGLPTSGAILGN